MLLLPAVLLTFFTSLALVPVVRALARRVGLVAAPRGDRWHRTPTALLGGVGIYAAFLVGFAVYRAALAPALPVVVAATLLFAGGLLDDAVQMRPATKLLLQLTAATIVVASGLHLPWTTNWVVNNAITVIWLIGITNAMNLLDNMDGLAGGIAAIACVFLAVTFVQNDQTALALLPALLCGAVLGFLVFNFKPASIFMGDCGSMFLGCALGGTALLSEYGRSRNLSAVLITPVLILTIPILDTCLVTVTRRLSGRPVSQGGRDHTSHRLVALGASERRAVLTLYVVAAASGMFALGVRWLRTEALIAVLPGFALLVILFALYLGTVRLDQERRGEDQALGGAVPARYRVAEVALDIAIVGLAYYGAHLLRFDAGLPPEQRAIIASTMPLVLLVEIGALFAGGVYRELWRFARVEDLLIIVRSTGAGAAISAAAVLLMYRGVGPSRAVLVLNGLLLLIFATASRLAFRLFDAIVKSRSLPPPDARPVLIYGTGEGGALIAHEIASNPVHRYAPVGFVDDKGGKGGRRLQGLRVFAREEVAAVIQTLGVSEILVSNLGVGEDRLSDLRHLGLSPRRMTLRFE